MCNYSCSYLAIVHTKSLKRDIMEDPSSVSMCNDDKMQKFILLDDCMGSVITKSVFGALKNTVTRSNSFNALKGSLFKFMPDQPSIDDCITIASVNSSEHYIENCSLKNVKLLTEKEYNILLAIQSFSERSDAIIRNGGESKLDIALEAKVGSAVEVYDEKNDEKIGIGYLNAIVPIQTKTKQGTYFEVLLADSDGSPLTIPVPLNRIKFLSEESNDNKRKATQSNVNTENILNEKHQRTKGKSEHSVKPKGSEASSKGREQTPNENAQKQSTGSSSRKNKDKTKTVDATELPVGSRVLHFPEGHSSKPVHGVVRFLGTVLNDGVFAGVELDESSKGSNFVCGNYYKGAKKLFDCEFARGLIVRPHELIKEEDYFTDKEGRKKTNVSVKKDDGSQGNDLVQRESKKPEVKTMDNMAKEQEEMFKKLEEKRYASMDIQPSQNYPITQDGTDRQQALHIHDQEIHRLKNEVGIKTPPGYKAAAVENRSNSYPFVNNNVDTSNRVSESVHMNVNQHNMVKRNDEGFDSTDSVNRKEFTDEQLSLEIGDMVEITIQKNLHYGVLKWTGKHERSPDMMAGVELESNDIKACTSNGTFLGVKYFDSPSGRAFFTKLHHCKRDSRFAANNTSVAPSKQIQNTNRSIQGSILPKTKLDNRDFGVKRGIQGHYNSCYMDSTLFAMFAYSHVFDVLLNRKKRKNDIEEYDIIKDILKEQIVNPLRNDGYVDHESVFALRKYLNKFTTIGGFMNEEKDPEEFIVLLFEKVLNVDPFIKLRVKGEKDNDRVSHLYQIFPPKEEKNPLPSIQYLLETSFLASNLQLADVPSVMVLQMPRFGQEKMYQRVQITSKLDITPLLVGVPHKCVMCDQLASIHCQECACQFGGWDMVHTHFCESCYRTVHQHPKRCNHQKPKLPERGESTNTTNHMLELFAVVCIEKSHYVSFVKCGEGEDENWVFFDSMADRVGEENGYNIPQVTEINNLKHYLNGSPLDISELGKNKDDGLILRVFNDSSLCFYRNISLNMYR